MRPHSEEWMWKSRSSLSRYNCYEHNINVGQLCVFYTDSLLDWGVFTALWSLTHWCITDSYIHTANALLWRQAQGGGSSVLFCYQKENVVLLCLMLRVVWYSSMHKNVWVFLLPGCSATELTIGFQNSGCQKAKFEWMNAMTQELMLFICRHKQQHHHHYYYCYHQTKADEFWDW